MSHYAPQVRSICEYYAGLSAPAGGLQVDSIIDKAIPHIFTGNWPIFDEEYRNTLCHKILRHYYMREIGFETVGEWVLELNTRLFEIMPKYNLLYESEPVTPYANYYRKSTRENNGNSTTNLTTNSKTQDSADTDGTQDNVTKHLDTPSGSLEDAVSDNYVTSGEVERGTVKNHSEGNSQSTVTNTGNDTSKNTETLTENGINGISLGEAVSQFAALYNDVDVLIINDLSDLFCLLWG